MNTLFDSFRDELEKIADSVKEYGDILGEGLSPREAKRLADHRQRRGKKTRGAPSRNLKQMFPSSPMTLPARGVFGVPGSGAEDTPRTRSLDRAFERGRREARLDARPGIRVNLDKAYNRNLRAKNTAGRHILRLEQSGSSPKILEKYEKLFERKHGKTYGVNDAREKQILNRYLIENRHKSKPTKASKAAKYYLRKLKRLVG